jgi:hypothetical protein
MDTGFIEVFPSETEIRQLGEDDSKLKIIGMITHPGVYHFLVYCEYKIFTPRTKANDDFQLILFPWEGFLWAIATVPVEQQEACLLSAVCTEMKLQKGSPSIHTPQGTKFFPLQGNQCFTLQHNSASCIYDGQPVDEKRSNEELNTINEIFKSYGDPEIVDEPFQ